MSRSQSELLDRSGSTDPAEQRLTWADAAWRLTPRQIGVLRQLLLGRANKEIAQALGCAEATVERHVTDLLRKAKVDSRLSLVAAFWRLAAP